MAVALGSCAADRDDASTPPAPLPASQNAESGEAPLLVVQSNTHPGSTNVEPTAGILFAAKGFTPSKYDPSDSFERRLDQLSKRTRFLGSAGGAVSALVVPESTQGPDAKTFSVRPSAPLNANQWYILEILQDGTVQVLGDSEQQASPSSLPYRSHFFTGSAPRFRRAELTRGKPADAIRIEFSEPIDIATLNVTALVEHAGKAVSTCIQLNGSCSTALPSAILGAVEVRLTAAIPENPEAIRLSLPASAKGQSHSVAEGVASAGGELTADALLTQIGSWEWRSCQKGAARCWQAVAALP